MERRYVTIVSGLPRSGTSMMMQMLEAGGLPALTDNIRRADEDNPRGYYEFEPVKKTREDASWLDGAAGKVVKMVYRLLYDLPQDRPYRVVFTRRRLNEVLASQKIMLDRLGRGGDDDEQIAELFRTQLAEFDQWVGRQECFRLLDVHYRDVLAEPREQAKRISDFLDGGLDVDAMAAAVDPSLYRNR